jgi:hypothetical protein
MKIYHYNENKEYIGESEARIDPLESKLQKKIIFALPRNATNISPGITKIEKNEKLIFLNNKWEIIKKKEIIKNTYKKDSNNFLSKIKEWINKIL